VKNSEKLHVLNDVFFGTGPNAAFFLALGAFLGYGMGVGNVILVAVVLYVVMMVGSAVFRLFEYRWAQREAETEGRTP
jgi:asparagine N-glycosylation enzyme membrane subunit Stt3